MSHVWRPIDIPTLQEPSEIKFERRRLFLSSPQKISCFGVWCIVISFLFVKPWIGSSGLTTTISRWYPIRVTRRRPSSPRTVCIKPRRLDRKTFPWHNNPVLRSPAEGRLATHPWWWCNYFESIAFFLSERRIPMFLEWKTWIKTCSIPLGADGRHHSFLQMGIDLV